MANFTRYKIPNDFLKRMINYKLINVLPSFKWKLNDGKRKDPRNIVISSIILFPLRN